jgi:hypothetical protein
MSRFWPWIVVIAGFGMLVSNLYAGLDQVVYFEDQGLPLGVNPAPWWVSMFIALLLFVGGLAVGISRSITRRRESRGGNN